jgi:PAS domain S-box-containing protein
MKITQKLFVSFGVAATLVAAHFAFVLVSTGNLERELQERSAASQQETELSHSIAETVELLRTELQEAEVDRLSRWTEHVRRGMSLRSALRSVSADQLPRLTAEMQAFKAEVEAFEQPWDRYATPKPGDSAETTDRRRRDLLRLVDTSLAPAALALRVGTERLREADSAIAAGTLHLIRLRSLTFLGAEVLLFVGLGWYWTRTLVGPLRRMEADARAVRAGTRKNVRIAYNRTDELGAVAQAFNDALDGLQSADHLRAKLEQLVAERTFELTHSVQQLRQLTDNLPEGALFQAVVPSGGGPVRLTYLGDGLARLTGIPVPADAGPEWFDRLVLPEDMPDYMAARAAAIRSRTPLRHEFRIRDSGGSVRWLSLRANPRPEAGGATLWDGLVLDITRSKVAQIDLERQAGFYSALNETTLDLIAGRETEAVLQAVVERAAGVFDAPHVEISLLEGDVLVTHAYHGRMANLVGDRVTRDEARMSWQAVDTREPVATDDYTRTDQPRPFYLGLGARAAVVFPIVQGPDCLGVIGMIRFRADQPFSLGELQQGQVLARQIALVLRNSQIYDQAERVAAARTAALRTSEQRLREAQRLARVGHWVHHFEGPRTDGDSWSDEAYRLCGLTPQSEDLDRSRLELLIHPDDRTAARRVVESAFAARRAFAVEYRLIRPDGTVRRVRDAGEPFLDEAGRAVGMRGVLQDLSD